MKYKLGDLTVSHWNDWDRVARDPFTIGNFIIAGLNLSTTSLFVIYAVGYVAISAVTSWALAALAPKPDFSSLGSQGVMVNAREATAPADFVYGEVRKGGTVTFYESTGEKNKFLHQIIVLAGHEVEAIEDIYINEEVVAWDEATGFVTSGEWGTTKTETVQDGFYESGRAEGQPKYVTTEVPVSNIRIQKFLGDQTTAASDLLAESELTGDDALDANFVGHGIAYLYVRYEYDRDVFANGLPLVTAKVKGKKVYDPRTDTTAYSDNAALCMRDFITTNYGLNDSAIDDVSFAAAANESDEDVRLSTIVDAGNFVIGQQYEIKTVGTTNFVEIGASANAVGQVFVATATGSGTGDAYHSERRYTINGIVKASSPIGKVLGDMSTACAGTLFWGSGYWKLKVGVYSAPVKSLTLDDLRGPINLSTRTSMRDSFNGVSGTFNNAAEDYITADYPAIKSDPFKAEDGGEELLLDLPLPYTTSASAAQRIAKLTLFRGREQMAFSADFGLNAFDVEVGDIVSFTNERYGFNAKEFEVIGWAFASNQDAGDLRVTLTLQETSEAAFDWNAEETAIISNNTNLPVAAAGLTVSNLGVFGAGETQSDGTFVNAVIFNWDAVDSAMLDHYEVEWKPVTDSTYLDTRTPEISAKLSPLIDGLEYVFRVRAVTVSGIKGPFTSTTFTVGGDLTAPSVPTSLSATGTLGFINLSWVNPADVDFNYVEVWESADNNIANATQVARAFGDTFNRGNLGPLLTRYYWVRAVDFSDNKSAFVGPEFATTSQVTAGDIGPAVIGYDNFASDVATLFEDIETDISQRVLVSDYNITVDLQQQLEASTTQLAEDALQLALNASSLESRINDAGITVDPATGSVVIQGLATVDDRLNETIIDLNAAEAAINLKASVTYVNDQIAAATLPEASLAALEGLEARVDTVEIDVNAVEGAITLTSSGSLYNVNDGSLGVQALRTDIEIAQDQILLKASATDLDNINTRLGVAEVTISTIDVPTITLAVSDTRRISEKQDDLADLSLAEVVGRYNDRKYVTQDVALARQSLTADVNEQGEAIATLETELRSQIGFNEASILSEQQTRATADSALASDITQLEATVVDLDAEVVGNASAVSSLEARVTSNEGSITSQASQITTLESDLTTLDGETSGNATAISGLDTRVTVAEGSITSQATEINTLQSDLTTLDGETSGNATAISGLDTRVTSAEGSITSQASQINSLSTTVGDNTTSITQAATSIDGIEGKYGVEIDNNGSITGYQLLSGVGGSAFNVRADQFNIFDADGNGGNTPFSVFTSSRTIGGVVYPAGTYIEDAYIDNAALVNGSITNANIKDAAITNAKIEDAAITTAKIGDLQVDTLKIANQAVSNTGADTGSVTTSSSAYQTVADVTLTTDGGNQLIVQSDYTARGNPAGGEGQVGTPQIRLLVGTTTTLLNKGTGLFTSLAGTTRVRFQVRRISGDGSVTADATMVVTELKK